MTSMSRTAREKLAVSSAHSYYPLSPWSCGRRRYRRHGCSLLPEGGVRPPREDWRVWTWRHRRASGHGEDRGPWVRDWRFSHPPTKPSHEALYGQIRYKMIHSRCRALRERHCNSRHKQLYFCSLDQESLSAGTSLRRWPFLTARSWCLRRATGSLSTSCACFGDTASASSACRCGWRASWTNSWGEKMMKMKITASSSANCACKSAVSNPYAQRQSN